MAAADAPRRIAAPWLADPALGQVTAALAAPGPDGRRATPRFVGGAVRNALIAGGPTDIDIAIDSPPRAVIALLESAGLKAIPTGIAHGTVTTLAGRTPIEVTSLRRDVATDGRRAVIAFTEDWVEDAARRDFTMNALYAEIDGTVVDPLGQGLDDLAARRVRFIGRAEDRIREDYLRILRYYRFAAWYGAPDQLLEGDLAAAAALRDGLSRLSRERVGQELKKLFGAPRPAAMLTKMAAGGVLDAALPGADAAAAPALERLEAANAAPEAAEEAWPRRLAAAFPAGAGASLGERLRLSRAETARLERIETARALADRPGEAGFRAGWPAARDALLIEAARAGAPDPPESAFAAARRGAAARLPITARHLLAAGLPPGPPIGAALTAAEEFWIRNNFDMDADALLRQVVDHIRRG